MAGRGRPKASNVIDVAGEKVIVKNTDKPGKATVNQVGTKKIDEEIIKIRTSNGKLVTKTIGVYKKYIEIDGKVRCKGTFRKLLKIKKQD